MLRASTIAVLLCRALSAATPQYILPDGVKPIRHKVEITIDPAQDHFSGVAQIDIQTSEPQTEFWVNGRDLTVTQASIRSGGNNMSATWQMTGGEFIRIAPAQSVSAKEVTLVISYTAPLSATGANGPYRVKTGEDWYAFTTFTPTDARRAFPCFDEPRFKTPWEISLRVLKSQKGFSNAPAVKETNEAGPYKRIDFAATAPLAAEVVAFAVGPFDIWEGNPAGVKSIPVRVLTARGAAKQGAQAAVETVNILPRLEQYTGIPYPWEKLDHVALPRSAFGAVENPGLITYIGGSLLSDPDKTDELQQRSIRGLQAHEIGHQWFGNLVTQASWTDVWLSEGFATWFSARTMDEEQPEDRKYINAVMARERIEQVDDGPQTRVVRLERQTRDELKSVYAQMVYQKGGAILMMLENWLGADHMQAGLRAYLKAHQFGNATTADLEAALKSAAEVDPTEVMNGYLNTTGVPRVSVDVTCSGDAETKLTFKRESGKTSVPVCWRNANGGSCAVVGDSPRDVTVANQSCSSWLFPNANGTGYYRTVWSAGQLQALQGNLTALGGAERLTLVYDLRAFGTPDASGVATAILQQLTADKQPEIAKAAKVALGLEKEDPPRRRQ